MAGVFEDDRCVVNLHIMTNREKYHFDDFTLDNYRRLVKLAKEKGFQFILHKDEFLPERKDVIWRHDVEFEPDIALKMAQIENMDARELIPMYNRKNTLLYVDPPYLRRTRTNRHYAHEFCSVALHQELLELCLHHKGPCIVSGYEDPLYEEALKGWEKRNMQVATNAGGSATEIIWLNAKANQEQKLF